MAAHEQEETHNSEQQPRRDSLLPFPPKEIDAALDRCLADGAAVAALSLASSDDVNEPLMSARAAGARVFTFNAGVVHAESVGSQISMSLNDRAAGQLAG